MAQQCLADLLPGGYIDAHHHVWAPETRADDIGYRWLRDIGAPKPFGDPTPIQRDYLWEEFLAEASLSPRASVHVQTDNALPDPVAETKFVHETAAEIGHPVAIVGLANLSADDLGDTLRRHAAYDTFRGVRQIVARLDQRPDLSFAPRDYMADPAWRDGLKRLEDTGLTFDLQLYPEQAEQALEALSGTPALTVIIDHALSPYYQLADPSRPDLFHRLDRIGPPDPLDQEDEDPGARDGEPVPSLPSAREYATWLKAVEMLATRPNTYIKLSGWGMYRRDWATDGIAPVGSFVFDCLLNFGAKRIMWGSNYPVEKLATPYHTALQNTVEYMYEQYREDIFLNSCTKAYGIKLT